MPPLPLDLPYLQNFLIGLLNTPSPTGLAEPAIEYVERELAQYPMLRVWRTPRGSLLAEWPEAKGAPPKRALTAHVDTLGAMVKEIKYNGCLQLTRLGGLVWPAVETEGCTIFLSSGKTLRGSLMLIRPSSHVHGEESSAMPRNSDTLEVRLDELTHSASETRALGAHVGDYVAFDPRVEVAASGYIRSRFLDDKAGVACVLAAIKALVTANVAPAQSTLIHISNYEEVGFGGIDIPQNLDELVVVDMAAIGEGQTSNERDLTICFKDAGGPYHIDLTRKLMRLADAAGIHYQRDIYVNYASDGTAYWRAGGAARVALIGPGVGASHNYERTHLRALERTAQLVVEYLKSE
jgi:putative aminopeptidase FrvX